VNTPIPGCTFCSKDSDCDVGNACTTGTCSDGNNNTCEYEPVSCNDRNPCTTDTCDPTSGCKNDQIPGCKSCSRNSECNDGDACTQDRCNNGVCKNNAVSCNDGNACTTDSCDPASGCKHDPISDCKSCSRDSQCNDGNVCTSDRCVNRACTNSPTREGRSCNDNDPNTSGDVCKAGVCTGTSASCIADTDCGSGKSCCNNACVTKVADGQSCSSDCVCTSGHCDSATSKCVECIADTDCGSGESCCNNACVTKAADGQSCSANCDCTSGACENSVCAASSGSACSDSVPCQSGLECCDNACFAQVADGVACTADCDCTSGACENDVCAASSGSACSASVPCQSGLECCGDVCITQVADGVACTADCDCTSGACENSVCAASSGSACSASVPCQSGLECCDNACFAQVADGVACTANCDCISGQCSESDVCVATACDNGRLDTDETDIDCCGSVCEKCADGMKCTVDNDCTNSFCNLGSSINSGPETHGNSVAGGVCATPTCDDGYQNGGETGIDCGGSCLACDGDPCDFDTECVSVHCDSATGKCVACTVETQATDCFDDETCTQDLCDPTALTCSNPKLDVGGVCTDNCQCTSGHCDSATGKCVACTVATQATDCSDGDTCTQDICDETTLTCSNPKLVVGETCDDNCKCTSGHCDSTSGKCVASSPTCDPACSEGQNCGYDVTQCEESECSVTACCPNDRYGITPWGEGCCPEDTYFDQTDGCVPLCGNGMIDNFEEECDDGNRDNGDGCSDECWVEYGVSLH
jgi:hypothetical protein